VDVETIEENVNFVRRLQPMPGLVPGYEAMRVSILEQFGGECTCRPHLITWPYKTVSEERRNKFLVYVCEKKKKLDLNIDVVLAGDENGVRNSEQLNLQGEESGLGYGRGEAWGLGGACHPRTLFCAGHGQQLANRAGKGIPDNAEAQNAIPGMLPGSV